jgi:hypothetical protein
LYLSAVFASVLLLAGCETVAGYLGGAGSPMDAQASMTAKGPNDYPAVHDVPPERAEPLMTPAEQARIRGELTAARGRQAPAAAAKTGPRPDGH